MGALRIVHGARYRPTCVMTMALGRSLRVVWAQAWSEYVVAALPVGAVADESSDPRGLAGSHGTAKFPPGGGGVGKRGRRAERGVAEVELIELGRAMSDALRQRKESPSHTISARRSKPRSDGRRPAPLGADQRSEGPPSARGLQLRQGQ